MARKGGKKGGGKLGGFAKAMITGGSQLENPKGPTRGPKTLRIGTGAMRAKMRGA